ncbi:MAG TPA: prolyl oligopeptidase family serine peptidase, partial [Steroidobacteraceae bacterium]
MTTIDRRTLLLTASSAAALATLPRFAFGAAKEGPLVARVEPVTDTYFGQSVTDPYRWMENPGDKDWEIFMKSQAAHTRAVLDGIPGRAALAKRVSELAGDLEVINTIQIGGSYVFVEKRPAGANNFKLFVREGLNGAERLLIDSEARTQGDVHYSMNYWSASPDGRHVAYGMSPSGSENAVIEIIETATGTVLPDRIDRAQYAFPSWLPDGSGFFFNRLAEGGTAGTTDYYKNSVCWLHRVGTEAKSDVKVLARGQFADVVLQEIEFPIVFAQPGSNHAIAFLFAGVQNEITMYVNSLDAAAKGQGGWKNICVPDDKVTGGTLKGDDIYLVTYKNAPRYKVLHVKAADPAIAKAREVVAQGNTVIQNVYAAKDALYVQELDGGVGRIRKLAADGKITPIALPFDGTISSVYADTEHDGLWFQLQNWVRPATVFQAAASGAVTDTKLATKPDIDVSAYESTRIFATARDGTKIPVSVVYSKGMKRDGSAPALIDAYGSYGITSDAYFGPRFIAWLEQGGVWATAHVRGGGEFGREWHEGGRLLTKHNTWGDMIAAAETLIADRWTSAERLAIRGGSAGGITVGRAMTARPGLFAAVISQVGVSNNLRAEFSQNGPPNIPEFGSVTTADGFKGLFEMDSYLHVKDGTKYPAMMLTTGMTDPRVDPWQAAKMAARVQKATTSGKPVLLRVDFQAGHGLGSTRAQRDEEFGDIFAFILWQAGIAG